MSELPFVPLPHGLWNPRCDPSRIRCVALDAVGTLIEPRPPAAEVYHDVARRHGSALEGQEIARRFRQAFRETEQGDRAGPAAQRLATSEPGERERWRTIVERVIDDIADRDACFEELFAHFARPSAWRVFEDVPSVLARIARSGRRLALASNFDGRLHAVCDGLPALREIGCRVISSEAGFRKPSAQFYDALLAAAGCRRDELLMVGDDPDNDLHGAQECGIAAVLVQRRRAAGPDVLATLDGLADWLETGRLTSPAPPAAG